VSIGIQHKLGADIIFAFDELTTLVNTRGYQEESVQRTHAWAVRCLLEHRRLTALHPSKPAQALFGVVQGAQYEDLRRQATRGLVSIVDEEGRGFDGYGIGGALEKQNLATIVGWVRVSVGSTIASLGRSAAWLIPVFTLRASTSRTQIVVLSLPVPVVVGMATNGSSGWTGACALPTGALT